jgi:Cytochrome P450
MGGRFHRAIDQQHKIHGELLSRVFRVGIATSDSAGPVFRVSPNELSFASVASWKDIYSHPPAGKQVLIKSEFYDMYGSGFKSLCIGSERVPQRHRRMKTSLSAAFSTKALLERESIVAKVVDSFVSRVGKEGGPGSQGMNMTKWFEMVAFDILGEMAFGESFHSIEHGQHPRLKIERREETNAGNHLGKPHFWSELILEHLFFITVADNLRRFPLVPTLARLVFPSSVAIRNKHTGFTRDRVAR